jgi:hypothetical protein
MLSSFCTAATYIIVGGQHIVEALRRRRAKLLAANVSLPTQYMTVSATVLRHDTPLPVRLYAAGDSQAQQGTVEALAVEDMARLFLHGGGSAVFCLTATGAVGGNGGVLIGWCCLEVLVCGFVCHSSHCVWGP